MSLQRSQTLPSIKFPQPANNNNLFKGKRTEVIKAISSGKEKPCSQRLLSGFKNFDSLGEKIRFTYKGEKSYKTLIGAFFSIC